MSADLDHLTIATAADLIASRRLSPVELTEAKLARIAALDSQLDSFITVTGEQALAQARRAEADLAAGRRLGPLQGIPLALKDIFNTAGIRTTAHSRILIDHVPNEDAATVTRLKMAGAVLLGKLATHEFAHAGPSLDLPWPPARNPWDRTRIPGGSSSGAGAAVAAGLALGALGSDTGGSIRIPAALCGIAGFKPTYGLVSRAGVVPNSFSLDHCGPMAWTVEDCAILLQAIAGHDPADPGSAAVPVPDYRLALGGGLKGLRVGVIRHYWEDELPAPPAVRVAMEESLKVLANLGATLRDVRLPSLQVFTDVKFVIAQSELYATHEKEFRSRPGDFSMAMIGRALPAILFRGADYVNAQRLRRELFATMRTVYDRCDVLVTAGTYGPPGEFHQFRAAAGYEVPNNTTPFNVTAGPALSLCNGFDAKGFPTALQVVGRPFDDALVLKVGHAVETATGWRSRRPALAPGAAKPAIKAPTFPDRPPNLDPATLGLIETLVRRARLDLSPPQFHMLCESAPGALAMTARLAARRYDWTLDPASTFHLRKIPRP